MTTLSKEMQNKIKRAAQGIVSRNNLAYREKFDQDEPYFDKTICMSGDHGATNNYKFHADIHFFDLQHEDDGSICFCRPCIDISEVQGLVTDGFAEEEAYTLFREARKIANENLSYEEALKIVRANKS